MSNDFISTINGLSVTCLIGKLKRFLLSSSNLFSTKNIQVNLPINNCQENRNDPQKPTKNFFVEKEND